MSEAEHASSLNGSIDDAAIDPTLWRQADLVKLVAELANRLTL